MKKRSVITAIALTLYAGLAAPAFAGTTLGENSFEVDIADLDLKTPEGQAIAERRIERAAKKACAPGGMRLPVSEMQRQRECMTIAKANALASLYPRKSRVADTGSIPEG